VYLTGFAWGLVIHTFFSLRPLENVVFDTMNMDIGAHTGVIYYQKGVGTRELHWHSKSHPFGTPLPPCPTCNALFKASKGKLTESSYKVKCDFCGQGYRVDRPEGLEDWVVETKYVYSQIEVQAVE
jgi:hypothetical protein